MDGEDWTGLALVQPTRRREWKLRRGDELVAGFAAAYLLIRKAEEDASSAAGATAAVS